MIATSDTSPGGHNALHTHTHSNRNLLRLVKSFTSALTSRSNAAAMPSYTPQLVCMPHRQTGRMRWAGNPVITLRTKLTDFVQRLSAACSHDL